MGQKPIEGSTKSPKAILDDAHASPEGRGPKARVNPSHSASRHINSRRSRSDDCDSDEAGITPPLSFTWTAPGGYHPALRDWSDFLTGEVAEWSKARPC